MATDPREQLSVFLRDIKHDPDDDTPRLVLADWLQDQGDPRGELLALALEIDRLGLSDRRRALLERRARLLLSQYSFTWLGPLLDLPLTFRFERGFLHLEASAERFLSDKVDDLARAGAFDWVLSLRLTDLRGPSLGRLARSPLLGALPCLDLGRNRLGPDELAALLDSPRLGGLRALTLHYNRLGPRGAAGLAGCPRLSRLRALRLAHNGLGDEGARALAGSPHLNALTLLDVGHNHVSTGGLAALQARFGAAAAGR
jgi:uncharacterized protein (TIGR02996 family)